jgi:hypothetical protein
MSLQDIITRRLCAAVAVAASVAAFAGAPAARAAEAVPPAAAPAEAGATLDRARQLLDAGQAGDAYALLAPREADWAGTPSFDYLLGVAALDTGRAGEAVFSLERVLSAQPDFDGARLELARAHFEAGDLAAARAQFSYLATRAPPAEAGRVIDRYVAAIDQRTGQGQQRWSGFLETGAGYDSNANGATGDVQFLGLELNAENVETDSAFVMLAGGVDHSAGVMNGLSSASSLRIDYRNNPDAHFVDQAVASAATALYWSAGSWRTSGGINGFYGWLDGSAHESYLGLNAGLTRFFGDSWELGARLQGGPVRYHDQQLEVLDVNRYLGALTLTRYAVLTAGGRVSVSLVGGTDDAQNPTPTSDYSNDRIGGRLTGSWPIGQSTGLYLEAGYLQSDYADSPGFFGTDRQDDQYAAVIAADVDRWPGDGWTLSPHLRYVRNQSNVPLYDYDRWEAGVSLRRSFR